MSLYHCSFKMSFGKFVSFLACQFALLFLLSFTTIASAESVTVANLSNYDFYYVLVDSSDNNTVYALVGTKSTSPCYADGDGTQFCKRSMYLVRVDRNQLNKLYLGDYYLNSTLALTSQDKYLNSWHGALGKSGSTVYVFFNHKASNGTYAMSSKLFTISAPSGVNSLTKTSEKTPFSDDNWGWYPKVLSGGTVEHFLYAGYQRCKDSQCGEQFSSSVAATVMYQEYRTSMQTDSLSIMPDISNADIAARIVAKATGSSSSSGKINGISTRARVGTTAEKYMMAGVYVRGTAQKKALVRATGKGLAKQGVNTSLDTKLEVYELAKSTTSPIDFNNDWMNHATYSAVQAAGGMPSNDDSALISSLSQGYYSMVVMPSGGSMSAGGGSSEGIGLVEIYDNDPSSSSRLSGISTRSYVGSSAADYMYAGLAIQGGSLRLLIRGLGKGLAAQGVSGSLDDAVITVRKADGTVVDSNDNWQNHSSSSVLTQRGQAPKESSDAAMIINLFEGLYTIEVKSSKGGSGVALVEVYEIVD